MNNIGERITEGMKRKGLRAADLARRAGLSRATVSNMIHGRREGTPESLSAIADALGIPREELYRDAGYLSKEEKHNEQIERIVYRLKKLDPEHLEMFENMANSMTPNDNNKPRPKRVNQGAQS